MNSACERPPGPPRGLGWFWVVPFGLPGGRQGGLPMKPRNLCSEKVWSLQTRNCLAPADDVIVVLFKVDLLKTT